jgi:PAS domain S-box-containing protein
MPSRALGSDFVAAFPGVIVVADADLIVEYAGGLAFQGSDVDPAAMKGRRIDEAVRPQLGALLLARFRAALAGERQTFDYVGVRTYSAEVFPRRAEDGEITGVFALAVEVTERRREERLRSDQMELAFAQAPIGVALVSREGRIVAANPALCKLFGYTAEELHGMTIADVTHPDDLATDLELFHRVLANELDSYRLEKRYLTSSGEVVNAHLTVGAVRDDAGRPVQLIAQVEDVTEQKRVEAQLRDTQRLESLGLLAGGIAHDFNNLLVGVLGNASLALAELPGDADVRRRLESIELAAERASALTRQLLAYSGRGRFTVEAIDLSRETAELRELLHAAVPGQVDVRLDLGRGLPPVEGDVNQIRQVVMNLITNAAEAIEGEGVVAVRTGLVDADAALLARYRFADGLAAGPYVALTVRDDGCGMDEATLARIFDPFFTTKFTGRGLGLAAVLGIVRGHGGALRVVSRPGEGSTFEVLLPAGRAAPKPHAGTDGAGTAVLVVDDEEVVREVAAAVLAERGRPVLTAASGTEAQQVLVERGPEVGLVLLDLTMPGPTPEETVERIRELHPGIAILLTSGYTESAVGERLGELGVAGFLQKPWSTGELADLVDRILGA